MQFTHRDLIVMFILSILTLGFYLIYWTVITKNELNKNGANIPTAWLMIIPFANLYFYYKFAQAFAVQVLKDKSLTIPYFLLIPFLKPLGVLIYQAHMNRVH